MAVLGKNRRFEPQPSTWVCPNFGHVPALGQTIEGQKRIVASKLLGGQSGRGKAKAASLCAAATVLRADISMTRQNWLLRRFPRRGRPA